MGGISGSWKLVGAALVFAACQASPTAPVVDAGTDAGPPKPVARAIPPPPPAAPRQPPLTLAADDGCQPYWLLPELGCDASAIRRRFPEETRFCDPVHERVTRSSVVGAEGGSGNATDARVAEFLAGAQWNDDPEGLLSQKDGPLRWCRAIKAGRGASLTARSHFGDLQFLHGYATRAGETNRQVYDRLMIWLEFAYRVANGEIGGATKLKDVPVKGLPQLFPQQRGRTVAELLQTPSNGDLQARALGTLMHLVQDLLGDGHTQASVSPMTGRSELGAHFTPSGSVAPGHRGDTGWRDAWAEGAPLSKWPKAEFATQRGIDLIRLAAHKQAWEVAQQYLVDVLLHYGNFDAKALPWKGPRE